MIYTLVENVRSLYNVGTIFRTADGAGVDKIFLTGITGRPPHKEIRKVALGAEESVTWEYHHSSIELARDLKQKGIQIVVLETGPTSEAYDNIQFRFPCCLVIGNEYHGVSPELMELADKVIAIPMKGAKISLNVGVAFGIAVYEMSKQRI